MLTLSIWGRKTPRNSNIEESSQGKLNHFLRAEIEEKIPWQLINSIAASKGNIISRR